MQSPVATVRKGLAQRDAPKNYEAIPGIDVENDEEKIISKKREKVSQGDKADLTPRLACPPGENPD